MLVPFQFTLNTIDSMRRWSPRISKEMRRDSALRRFWVNDVLSTWRRKGILVCDREEFNVLYDDWYENLPDNVKSLYDITKLPRVDRNRFKMIESEFPAKLVTLVCNLPGVDFERKYTDGSKTVEALFYAFSQSQQINNMYNLSKITTSQIITRNEKFCKLILPFVSIEKATNISIFDPYAINWSGKKQDVLFAVLKLINDYAVKLDVKKSVSIYSSKQFTDQLDQQKVSDVINNMRVRINTFKNIDVVIYSHVYQDNNIFHSHKSYIHDRYIKFGDNHVLDIGRGIVFFEERNQMSYYSTFADHKLVEDFNEYKLHIDKFCRAGQMHTINGIDNVILVDSKV